MIEIVKSKYELCTGCNRCVRKCPMETANVTYRDEAGNIKVAIDYGTCIACGRCVQACKHGARYFADDTERFFNDLSKGMPISVMTAPSIKTNIPGYKKLFTYLKRLGVNKIYDVSLGADICIWGHVKYFEKNGVAPMITQLCPVIVSYCEIHRHELLSRLSPVHGPMACASIYMKKHRGITDRIAAISPCIAKKIEFENTGLAEYNITFFRLLEYLKEKNVAFPEDETDFDHNESGLGSLFPVPGGLKENIEYFLGQKLHITKAEGFDIYEKLTQYANTREEFLPDIYDVLNCVDGCNLGPAHSHDRSLFEIDKTMHATRRRATEGLKKEYYEALYKTYDETFELSDFLRGYRPLPAAFPHITDADIQQALEKLNKTDYEKQHIDCGACGSDTCYGMARKIALQLNVPANCIFKSKEDAKAEHEENLLAHEQLAKMEKMHEADERMRIILDAMPFGTQIWDKKLKLIDCNQATVNLFKLSDKRECLKKFNKLSPKFQPDGRLSKDAAVEYQKKAFQEGFQRFEWMHQTPDGEMLPCEITAVRVAIKGDVFISSYMRDLREQKRMISKIDAAQITTSAMFESNPHINVLFDHNFRVVDCNPAALRFIGFESKEALLAGFTERMTASIPPFQSNGQPSVPLARRLMTAVKEGSVKFETEVFMGGIKRNLDVEFKRIPYEHSFAVVGYIYDMTEICEREAELARAKELNELRLAKLNLVVKATKIGLWDMEVVKDESINPANALMWSEESRRLLGYKDEAGLPNLLGAWSGLLHPDDKQRTFDAFEKHLADKTGKAPYDIEYRMMKKDGAYAYYRDCGETTRDEHGNAVRVAGALMDITETKNLLIDLHETAARLNAVISNYSGVIWCVDKDETITLFNGLYLEKIGVTPAFLEGKKLDAAQRKGRHLDIIAYVRKTLAGEPQDWVSEIDGKMFRSHTAPIYDGHGRVTGVVGSTQDMTETIELQKKVEAESATLQTMFNSVPDLIFCQDTDLNYTRCNKSLLKYFGIQEENLIGKDAKNGLGIPEKMADGFRARDRVVINEQKAVTFEEYLPARDGNSRLFETNKVPLFQSGRVTGIMGIARDITERKALEEAAQNASKAKSSFLSTMSHEIRTPMNAIIGMTAIGKAASDIERKDYSFLKIEDASKHLLGVINNVLDMSKIEAGRLDLSPIEFNFEKMLQRVVSVVNYKIAEKQQKFEIEIDKGIPEFLIGDDQRLAQVITNLVGNAVKFTPEGGEIRIGAYFLGEENGVCALKVTVTDSGIGISPEQQSRLFQSFSQADSGTARKFGGTGLGLTISKSIVEMMNGTIWIESELGRGATFAFTVQALRGGAGERKQPETLAGTEANFAQYRILLAEDVEINREIVLSLLEPTRLKIDCVENGAEALRVFCAAPEQYDMIFMDIQMPEMDGYEATRNIRAFGHETAKTVPIIAMTANVFKEDIDSCLAAGMNGHVGKPIDFDEVLQTLKKYLG